METIVVVDGVAALGRRCEGALWHQSGGGNANHLFTSVIRHLDGMNIRGDG